MVEFVPQNLLRAGNEEKLNAVLRQIEAVRHADWGFGPKKYKAEAL